MKGKQSVSARDEKQTCIACLACLLAAAGVGGVGRTGLGRSLAGSGLE